MNRKTRDTGIKAGATALATIAHVLVLGYLALYLRPFDDRPLEPPMNVELVQLPPLYQPPPPPLRGRLSAAELRPAPSSSPSPAPAAAVQPQVSTPVPTATPAQAPARNPAPSPSPRPEVLAASVIEIAPDIKPEPQAPSPASSAVMRAIPQPEFLPESMKDILPASAPLTASQPTATLAPSARPTGVLSPSIAAPMLREAAGGTPAAGTPAGAARPGGAGASGGIDDRWRVRPDERALAACPPIPPERMTAEQRLRCAPKPPSRPLNLTPVIPLRDARFEDAARRKELLRKYKASPAGQYPGLNCVFGGKCKR